MNWIESFYSFLLSSSSLSILHCWTALVVHVRIKWIFAQLEQIDTSYKEICMESWCSHKSNSNLTKMNLIHCIIRRLCITISFTTIFSNFKLLCDMLFIKLLFSLCNVNLMHNPMNILNYVCSQMMLQKLKWR